MNKIDYIHYDENVDHLTIYKNDEQVVSNIDTGLVIVSLNKNREIIGLEFMGAHKNFKIPYSVLEEISGCIVELHYKPEKRVLVINLLLKYKEQESPLIYSSTNLDLGAHAFTEEFACSAV